MKRLLPLLFMFGSCSNNSPAPTAPTPNIENHSYGELRASELHGTDVFAGCLIIGEPGSLTTIKSNAQNNSLIMPNIEVTGTISSVGITYIRGTDGKRYAFNGTKWIPQ